ncbi:MAG: SH3 domain-containing protein [Spirochaetales bacterium]|nr:SH3 domain-containing protein [Spirochaetales bacterium]
MFLTGKQARKENKTGMTDTCIHIDQFDAYYKALETTDIVSGMNGLEFSSCIGGSALKKLFICIFFFCVGISVFADEYRWSSGVVNVRTGPGTNYEIMGQLYKNEKVEIFNSVNGWAQILFEDVEAYVSGDLLRAERILTPEEVAAAELAAEVERQEREAEERALRIRGILKTVLFVFVGIVGFVIIVKTA